MTLEDMAALHAQCFTTPRPWSAAEFAASLSRNGVFTVDAPRGFALGQIAGPEAELLTLAVAPEARRQGIAHALVTDYHDRARTAGAEEAFLEVAADNHAAQALYAAIGYTEAGRRKAYYRQPEGGTLDALILRRPLHDT